MKTLNLENDIKQLYKIQEILTDEIGKYDFQLNLIVEELFANIVHYSHANSIKLNYHYDTDKSIIYLEFVDDGIMFNPLQKENPEKVDNIEDAKIGGLGIYLTKNMVDKIEYDYIDNENHLKIVKKVK